MMLSRTVFARALRPSYVVRCGSRLASTSTATGSAVSDSDPTKPPEAAVMTRLRSDLKTAMRNKDSNRLSVLRGLLTDLAQRMKSPGHPLSPSTILSVLSRHTERCRESLESFEAANRADLAEKETSQIKVLEEYIGQIEQTSMEEMEAVVNSLVWKGRGQTKPSTKNVREGALEILERERGKAVDMKVLMGLIKEQVG